MTEMPSTTVRNAFYTSVTGICISRARHSLLLWKAFLQRRISILLPLDGTRGFRRQVVEHAVDARHLGDDALGDVMKQRVGDLLDGGGHGVAGVHGTDDDGPVPRALVVFHARRLIVGHDGEVLPHLSLEAVLGKLLAQDGIALAEGLQTVAGDGACAAHTQSGSGNGWR